MDRRTCKQCRYLLYRCDHQQIFHFVQDTTRLSTCTSVGPVVDISIDQVKKTFDVNVFGALRTARAVIPHMASRRQGIIVNVGSIIGEVCVFSPFYLLPSASLTLAFYICLRLFTTTPCRYLSARRRGAGFIVQQRPLYTQSPRSCRWSADLSESPSSCSPQVPSSPTSRITTRRSSIFHPLLCTVHSQNKLRGECTLAMARSQCRRVSLLRRPLLVY